MIRIVSAVRYTRQREAHRPPPSISKTLLAIIFPVVEPFNRTRIFEHGLCQVEADSVQSQIRLGLGIVPFKVHTKMVRVISSFVEFPTLLNSGIS